MANLRNIEELQQACSDVVENAPATDDYLQWGDDLRGFLAEVKAADLKRRASAEFQRRIWEENPVSSTGMGTVSVDAALADPKFRNWLAERSITSLPDAPERKQEMLDKLYDDLKEKMGEYTNRTPRLKIYRVLACFFPREFTSLANIDMTKGVHAAMFGDRGGTGPTCHANILRRLDEVRGPAPAEDDTDAIVDRMRLPWLLYQRYVAPSGDERTMAPNDLPGEERLDPLPAARRKKGLTGVSGGRQALLNILEFCRDGASREDLKIHMKTINPRLKDTSINNQFYVIASELNCLRLDGDHVLLTDRGQAFLESNDPDELMDWLITRILGVDHALVILRDEGRCSNEELVSRLQSVNPGWTSQWGPRLITRELREFEMLDLDGDGVLSLTNAGKEWAQRIHWQPETLASPLVQPEVEVEATPAAEPTPVQMPPFSDLREYISLYGHFPERVIRKLHAGLWANERRHFAVLTGLSGSGKALLARTYGQAIVGERDREGSQLCTVTVQPGWYDPSALLGYINPLQGDSYLRTPFLEFLIAASDSPDRPFTVVLDEMNLSRPEQYLAPVLSAMETGEPLTLHSEGESFDGIPSRIPYPSNLVIIGTVNMDETTHGISDKVLDRAFTIEFWDVDLEAYPHWGTRDLPDELEQAARQLLTELMASLRPARLHFGWRVVDDVLDYTERAMADGTAEPETVLDDVVYAKILPKLRGDDSPRFRDALQSSADILNQHGLENCVRKVNELVDDLESTGSARFWR